MSRYVSQSEALKEETLKEGKSEKGKPEVQEEHTEGVLNKGLHELFHKITDNVAQESAGVIG